MKQAMEENASAPSDLSHEEKYKLRNELYAEIGSRSDEQWRQIYALSSVVGFLIFGAFAWLGYLAKSYIDQAKKYAEHATTMVEQLASAAVQKQLQLSIDDLDSSQSLVEGLRTVTDEYVEISGALDALREYAVLKKENSSDPSLALEYAKGIIVDIEKGRSSGDWSWEKARAKSEEARTLLAIVREAAFTGFFDPNEIYNASAVAGRLDFDKLQLELGTIAYHMRPSRSHLMAKLDSENNLGVGFEVKDGALEQLAPNAEAIREKAFSSALSLVSKVPTHQCEIILSRTWNMAERGREYGSFDRYMSVLSETDVKRAEGDEGPLPSYYYVTWAQLHSRNAALGWREAALEMYEKAIVQLANESPMATWYKSSIREVSKYSKEAGLLKEVSALAQEHGVELTDPDEVRMQALLQAIGAEDGLASLLGGGSSSDDDADEQD